MKTRIIVSVIFLPIIFYIAFFLPPIGITCMVSLIAAMASFEFIRAVTKGKNIRLYIYTVIFAAFMPFATYIGAATFTLRAGLFVLALILFAEGIVAYEKGKTLSLADILSVMYAGVIMPMFLSSFVLLKTFNNGNGGQFFVLLPFISAFISDSGAYFVGMAIGKHKVTPKTSPNKSWEGCIGGLVFTVAAMVVYGIILKFVVHYEVSFLLMALYGVVGSLATQIGDLAYSLIKRQYGIKDFGKLIPGHGGMMDRFDSMSFAAPAMYLMLVLAAAFAPVVAG